MATRFKTIPNSELKLTLWAKHFVDQVSKYPEQYQLGDQRVANLQESLSQWQRGFDAATDARDAARAATRRKDELLETLEANVRSAVRLIQGNDEVSDYAREEAGIVPHKTSRTPVPAPKTTVVAYVMNSDRLEHTISYADSASPTRRARPAGVAGCEVYVCVRQIAPSDPAEYQMVKFSTRTPQQITFAAEEGGQNANYLFRWINTKGQPGPWSQVVSGTIPAV